MEGDDLRWAIEAAVPRGADPNLHLFAEDDVWQEPVENLLERTLGLSSRPCRAAEAVLARHHSLDERFILEGFWILPEFAAKTEFNGVDMSGGVRCLFLFDADLSAIAKRRAARDDNTSRAKPQAARLDMFLAHGAITRRSAEALGLPVLESRPFETLEARALVVLDEGVA
ncbi:MAG TPA: hypothetical protein VFY10_12475 [Dehalococcoidia bacterium]|nr:hypothetical protein [Dehalococcoidia bacterium]